MRWCVMKRIGRRNGRVRARIHVADEELLLGEVRFHVGLRRSNFSGAIGWFTLPHQICLVESGSARETCRWGCGRVGRVTAANGPPDVTTPS